MTDESKLAERMKRIVNKRGMEALERAKTVLRSNFPNDDEVSEALRYFAGVTLRGALPVFPALVSLACDAVGSKTEKTVSIGGAIVLIAGAADVHDDVIDRSPSKGSKRTIFGKFGEELAILVGDVLLTQGLIWLQKECEGIPVEQARKIWQLLDQAVFAISQAEALEIRARETAGLSPEAYLDVIGLKSVVPELNMKIGAILGNGNSQIIETCGHFGKTFGIVSMVSDEFIDLLEYPEMKSRLRIGCPPLPFLYALRDPSAARVLSSRDESLTRKRFETNRDFVLSSPEVRKLRREIDRLVSSEFRILNSALRNSRTRKELETLLRSSLSMLHSLGEA